MRLNRVQALTLSVKHYNLPVIDKLVEMYTKYAQVE